MLRITITDDIRARALKIGRASEVRNCLGNGMEGNEGKVSMNNGIVAFVWEGDYYLSPDGYPMFRKLTELGFKDTWFMVICSAAPGEDEAPEGFEGEWKHLYETRPSF